MKTTSRIWMMAVWMFSIGEAPAQNTFTFKAQVLHNKSGPVKQLNLLIDGKATSTNDGGMFVMALTTGTNHVRISFPGNQYNILYPPNGFIAIPRDLEDFPQVIVGNRNENNYLNQYLSLHKTIRNSSNATAAEFQAMVKRMDSLQALLIQLHYTESELQIARDRQDGKDRNYPEITANILEFKSKAFDLIAAFKYVSEYAFTNPQALEKLSQAVTNYNHSRNLLERQRLNYEKYVAQYWQNEELTPAFHEWITFALDTVHKMQILPLSEQITLINNYFHGSRNRQVKDKIQQTIAAALPTLSSLLSELEKRTGIILQLLSDY